MFLSISLFTVGLLISGITVLVIGPLVRRLCFNTTDLLNWISWIIKTICLFIIWSFILDSLIILCTNTYDLFILYLSNLDPSFINNPGTQTSSEVLVDRPNSIWPSGTFQAWAPLGGALLTWRTLAGVHPVRRGIASGGAGAFIAVGTVYYHAVDNPNGYNNFLDNLLGRRRMGTGERVTNNPTPGRSEYISSSTDSTGLGDNIFNNFPQSSGDFLEKMIHFFKLDPVVSDLPLNVLSNQHAVIHYCLLIIVITIWIFLYLFITSFIVYYFRDKVVHYFNNKWVTYYIKYQAFVIRIGFIIWPIFIIIGLGLITHGLYYLAIHPIIIN